MGLPGRAVAGNGKVRALGERLGMGSRGREGLARGKERAPAWPSGGREERAGPRFQRALSHWHPRLRGWEHSLGHQPAWVPFQTWARPCCATLGKLLDLSGSPFPSVRYVRSTAPPPRTQGLIGRDQTSLGSEVWPWPGSRGPRRPLNSISFRNVSDALSYDSHPPRPTVTACLEQTSRPSHRSCPPVVLGVKPR